MITKVIDSLTASAMDVADNLTQAIHPKSKSGTAASSGMLALAVLCVVAQLDFSQLIFALIGAVAYSVLQSMPPKRRVRGEASADRPVREKKAASPVSCPRTPLEGDRFSMDPHLRDREQPQRSISGRDLGRELARSDAPWRCSSSGAITPERAVGGKGWSLSDSLSCAAKPKAEVRKPSLLPVAAPQFQAKGWEAEVDELLSQISPTPESDRVVKELAAFVQRTVARVIPEVEVVGFASGNLARGQAYGVAVPDVDIVINVTPDALAKRLQGRLASGRAAATKLDARKIQKSAIRTCTDRLVSVGGFKFRRSAFRGPEPKVTLLAPASPATNDMAVPVDFSVNAVTPLYSAALLTECGRIDSRAKGLMLMVKRWAKDRGVCHAAKGHLSPYLWNILTIYFLQVYAGEGEPILPPLEEFEMSSGLIKRSAGAGQAAATPKARRAVKEGAERKSVGELFKEFLNFYNSEFDWQKEAISIRLGRRAAPDAALPVHVVLREDGQTMVGPSVEDPFEAGENLGSSTTAPSLLRLREELKRAAELSTKGEASLTELLELWIPPIAEEQADEAEATPMAADVDA